MFTSDASGQDNQPQEGSTSAPESGPVRRNRRPPATHVRCPPAWSSRATGTKKASACWGNRPRPTARRSRETITRMVLECVGGNDPSKPTIGPKCATGVGFRCQLTGVAAASTRCFTAARQTHAAVFAWPLPHSISTASSVAAIAAHRTRMSRPWSVRIHAHTGRGGSTSTAGPRRASTGSDTPSGGRHRSERRRAITFPLHQASLTARHACDDVCCGVRVACG